MAKRKKIGLALGGGGAKGFAHIGVLKVLEENNIPIDMVSGTSIGSMIGAFHCAGYSANHMIMENKDLKWKKLLDFCLSKRCFIKGNKIEEFLRKKLENKNFEDLNKPLFITAVDIDKKEEIIFNKGDLVKAIRASISIPGIFPPVEISNRILIDGGWLDPLPIEILKKEGAEIIIAVNLSKFSEKKSIKEKAVATQNKKIPNMANALIKSFQVIESRVAKLTLEGANADIIISPEVGNIKVQDFDKAEQLIKLGEEAAQKQIKKIKQLIKPEPLLKRVLTGIKEIVPPVGFQPTAGIDLSKLNKEEDKE